MNKLKNALIIDDSRLAREGLVALLEAAGLSVKQASTVNAALAQLKSTPVDVVFMDSRMPDCDPYEIIRTLTRQPATAAIPVVVSATRDTPAEREKARKSGARGFLVKPITSRVVDKIVAFLEQAGSADLSAELQQDIDALNNLNLPVLELTENEVEITYPPQQPSFVPPSPSLREASKTPPTAAPAMPLAPAAPPPVAPALTSVSVANIMDQIRAAVQEVARETAHTKVLEVVPALVEKTARLMGQETGQQAGHEAGYAAGQQAGLEAGQKAGQQAGHQAGYQAGSQAGQQAGHQAGSQAGEKVARTLIDHVVEEELNNWKATAKTEVYELLQSRMMPLVRKLANEIATQEARNVAISTATEVASEQADTTARAVAAELSRTIAKGVASETAQATSLEVTDHFSAQWHRKLIRHTILIGTLSAAVSFGMAFLFHKLSYLF